MADVAETPTLLSAASSPNAGQTSPETTNPNPGQDQPPPAGEPVRGPSEPDKPQQPAGDQPNGDQQPHPGDAEPAITEEDYQALSLGDGVPVDDASFGEFKKLALEAQLKPDAAQKLLDLHGRMQAAAVQAWQAQVQDWRQQAESDPYLSGGAILDGGFTSLKEATAAAGRFLERFGDRELRQALDQVGLGNHPALVRALAKAGRELASDNLVTGQAVPRPDRLRAMYPTMGAEYFPN